MDAGDRLTRCGDVYYEYDEDARVAKKTVGELTWTYTYNDRSQLTSVTNPDGSVLNFSYDPLGRRVSKSNGQYSVRWNWNLFTPWREETQDRTGVHSRYFAFEPGTFVPLAIVEGDECFSCVTDQIGTPQELLSSGGRLAWAADYETWGRIERTVGEGARNPLRFQGQYSDDESGLHYNLFRYYDPDTGRYLTPDPSGLTGGFNAYAYPCDPLNWVDPLGLTSCKGRVQEHVDSWVTFFKTGIRPKHVRVLKKLAQEEGLELAFRKINPWKRIQSTICALLGVPPKPGWVEAKVSKLWGFTKEAGKRYRCDYDPAFYRKPGGEVLSDADAKIVNERLSKAMGEELQHGTHVTMDEAGKSAEKIKEIGTPGDTVVFRPDGTTGHITDADMKADESITWLWGPKDQRRSRAQIAGEE
jgi:RHS repeat-associated protein